MKFRSTLYLLIAFAVLLAFVLLVDFPGEEESRDYLVNRAPYDVSKIEFDTGEGILVMEKTKDEEWMITSPLNAPADKNQAESLAEDFSELPFEKVVEAEPAHLEKYGIPAQKIILHYTGQDKPEEILIGEKNPLDNTYFAKRAGESRVVLLPSRLSTNLEKSLIDFRKKDIFRFDTENVGSIRITNPDTSWNAEKKGEDWFLREPVYSLAEKTAVQGILDSLSSLKAEDFISENKTPEEMDEFGLKKPEYQAELNIPAANKKTHFLISKKDDNVYATTEESTKIVAVGESILENLDKSIPDLREKSIADFYTWEVTRISITGPSLNLTAVKDEQETWHLDSVEGPEADKQKIEDLLRKLSYLEASEFIDPPWEAEEYGLGEQAKSIIIEKKEDEEKKETVITLKVGKKDPESSQVIVKNERFDYIFRTEGDFLQEYPEQRGDWINKQEESAEEEKKQDSGK